MTLSDLRAAARADGTSVDEVLKNIADTAAQDRKAHPDQYAEKLS